MAIADCHFSFKLFYSYFLASSISSDLAPILFNVLEQILISMKQFLCVKEVNPSFSTVFFCCPVLRTLI
jgi:hypothetical protein